MNIVARLKEPSTWVGLAALIAVVSPSLAEIIPAVGVQIGALAAAIAALYGMFKKDPGSAE